MFRNLISLIYQIDTYTFYTINGALAWMPKTLISAIALGNTSYVNYIQGAYLVCCIVYIFKKQSKHLRIQDTIYNILSYAVLYEVCYLCNKQLKIERLSPSFVLQPLFNLAKVSGIQDVGIFRTDCFFSDTASGLMYISLITSSVAPKQRQRILFLGSCLPHQDYLQAHTG